MNAPRDVDMSGIFPIERLVRRWPRAAFVPVLVLLVLASCWPA